MKLSKVITTLAAILPLTGCGTIGGYLDPFREPPAPQALLGEMSDKALYNSGGSEEGAREALEAMSTYQRAHLPQPVNPVVRPAVVRLMWVPDHLNKFGDLVPAHYYYLKVKGDEWAVTDAFDLEGQLNKSSGGGGPALGGNSNLPYIYEGEKRR